MKWERIAPDGFGTLVAVTRQSLAAPSGPVLGFGPDPVRMGRGRSFLRWQTGGQPEERNSFLFGATSSTAGTVACHLGPRLADIDAEDVVLLGGHPALSF